MARTTIDIVQTPVADSKEYSVRLLEPERPGGSQAVSCPLPAPDWTRPDGVSSQGRTLHARLGNHPVIRETLSGLRQPPHQPQTLVFQLSDPEDERFYWETLQENGEFLALQNTPPISIVRNPGSSSSSDSTVPVFSREFRILALLSAFDRPAKNQWLGLRKAALAAVARGLNLRLDIRVGERDLLTEIQADVADNQLDFVTEVAFIPAIKEDFAGLLKTGDPHAIHFYCHGMARQTGSHQLRLATFQDWQAGVETRPLVLTTEDFRHAGSPWLVVLNSCDGGNAREGFSSFAYSLVSSCNVPHVVAMVEEFDSNDAHELCHRLYPVVLDHVLNFSETTRSNQFAMIDFSNVLDSARRALSQRSANPDGIRNWVIPALYMRRTAFNVFMSPQGTVPDGRLSEVITFLENNPNLPQEVKQQIVDQIFPELDAAARTGILNQVAGHGA